jgi:hypothetical protein
VLVRSRYLRDAGDRVPCAGDDDGQYRTHESPANGHIEVDAGDAVGISRASVARRTILLIRRLPAPVPESALEAASKAVVADEQLLDDPEGPNPVLRPSKRPIYTSMSGRPYLSSWTGGRNSCYPSPRISVLRECRVLARAHPYAGAPYKVGRVLGLGR